MLYDSYFSRIENDYLEPTEDERKVCFQCSICGEDICEGDEYYDFADIYICETCADEAHHYAELEDAV